MSKGETETSIRESLGICAKTVWNWRQEDKEFDTSIARARELGFDAMADECVKIADDPLDDPQSRRVRVDTRLRLLSKWCSGRYGERVDVNHSGDVELVITVGGVPRTNAQGPAGD